MLRILILYYSMTGNTEKMAHAIADGARRVEGAIVDVEFHVGMDDLQEVDAITVGAPTYHHDMPLGLKRIFQEAAEKGVDLKGKIGAAFGSFGWSGEAPRLTLEILERKFEIEAVKPPLLIKYMPDQKGLKQCREFGTKIANLVRQV
jgi:flavorubredoxin